MELDYDKVGGLIPAIVQEERTGQVLMLGYMNEEALAETQRTKKVTFFSRSKNRLWQKGESSGNFLELISLQKDCDSDSLLVKVKPVGPTCHTGSYACFGEEEFGLGMLEKVIEQRWDSASTDESYVQRLKQKGVKKIAQKVGEEGVEVALEAMTENREELIGELGDLLFHALVVMKAKDVSLKDVLALLEQRHKK